MGECVFGACFVCVCVSTRVCAFVCVTGVVCVYCACATLAKLEGAFVARLGMFLTDESLFSPRTGVCVGVC